jgi:hypothetical protein
MESQNQTSSKPASTTIQPKLVDIQIKDEFVALNVLVSFVNLAQRRGVFTIDESAKIWECVKKFQRKD